MKLWKGNKIDGEWELSNKEIVNKFLESRYGTLKYLRCFTIERALVYFISAKDGLNSGWEYERKKGSINGSKDMLEMLDLIDEAKK